MADSVDRVFVHALHTVKKIPRTGASRPPPADRLRLYGLYKQAMEGDVDGVMERPSSSSAGALLSRTSGGDDGGELQREKDKWDAWNAQRGLTKREAKRRYVEALIETMHRYATTADARELVDELEFVWEQMKSNSVSIRASGSSPDASSDDNNNGGSGGDGSPGKKEGKEMRRFALPMSGTDGPMKMLSPMSEDDEAEYRDRERQRDEAEEEDGDYVKKGDKWSRKVEKALVRLSAEVAALREQISTGREWRLRKQRTLGAWIGWLFWLAIKHLVLDSLVLFVILLWMRKRKDRRLEDLVRSALRLGREYASKVLPAR